jgi:pimeloyl-ACP methyl ester carboxylesterase
MKFIRVSTDAGLLDGVLAGAGTRALVIHIHGMCGNFYHNRFIDHFVQVAESNSQVSWLFVNHSGHDYVSETLHRDQAVFVGGSVVSQQRIDQDVVSIVDWAAHQNFDSVFLQGHSFGCDIVTRNQVGLSRRIDGAVLLSPCDSAALQTRYRDGEPVAQQLQRLAVDPQILADEDQILNGECGIKTGHVNYGIPMTVSAAKSFLESGPGVFRFVDEEPRLDVAINPDCPTFAYVGRDDEFMLGGQANLVSLLERTYSTLNVLKMSADHHFAGAESEVAVKILEWVSHVIRGDGQDV